MALQDLTMMAGDQSLQQPAFRGKPSDEGQ